MLLLIGLHNLLQSKDQQWTRRFFHQTLQKSSSLSFSLITHSILIIRWLFNHLKREKVSDIFLSCLFLAPEIPKTEAQKEEEEEEIQKEEEKPSTSSIATVEMKARYNPMAEVYRNISEEEPPSYMFTSNLPELYSLDLDVIRLTAQYTAINGRKVNSCCIHIIL